MHSSHPAALRIWLQPQQLAVGDCLHYRVGPLTLHLQRQQEAWLFGSETSAVDSDTPILDVNTSHCLPEALSTARFMFQQSPEQVQLSPSLLDRPVVVKTRQQVSIAPGEQATFYISSPVVVNVNLKALLLASMPVQRLSDTWFGPDTQRGELCYADKTHARHSLHDIPNRPHRVVTPVRVINQAATLLTLDKISIPLPFLAIYGQADGSLWTDTVQFIHEQTQGLTRFTLIPALPEPYNRDWCLAKAQQHIVQHGLFRAFSGIF